MKTNFFYIILLIAALSSCTKENEKMSPGTIKIIPFDVKISTAEFKVGESVKFQFQGNADTVYFYSGEIGKDYNYINGREATVENPTLTIRTGSSYGHQKSLSILLSQDFKGDYSYAGVSAATWKDMTSKFSIPAPSYGPDQTPPVASNTVLQSTSPAVNIGEFIEGDAPYYIAVRNNLKANSPGALTTQWYFYKTSFKFAGSVVGSPVDILTFDNADWAFVNEGYTGTRATMPYLTPDPPSAPTSIFFGRNSPSQNAMDSWAVTKAISSKVSLGGDKGTIIKRETDLPLEQYTYLYTTPGEYDVTFQGINKDKTKSLVKLKLKIIP